MADLVITAANVVKGTGAITASEIAGAVITAGQTLYKDPGYDAQRDFVPVANLAASPNILVAHPSDPAADLRQFLQNNKGRPVSYGSAGVGIAECELLPVILHGEGPGEAMPANEEHGLAAIGGGVPLGLDPHVFTTDPGVLE